MRTRSLSSTASHNGPELLLTRATVVMAGGRIGEALDHARVVSGWIRTGADWGKQLVKAGCNYSIRMIQRLLKGRPQSRTDANQPVDSFETEL